MLKRIICIVLLCFLFTQNKAQVLAELKVQKDSLRWNLIAYGPYVRSDTVYSDRSFEPYFSEHFNLTLTKVDTSRTSKAFYFKNCYYDHKTGRIHSDNIGSVSFSVKPGVKGHKIKRNINFIRSIVISREGEFLFFTAKYGIRNLKLKYSLKDDLSEFNYLVYRWLKGRINIDAKGIVCK